MVLELSGQDELNYRIRLTARDGKSPTTQASPPGEPYPQKFEPD
jgi:hypothetical protein